MQKTEVKAEIGSKHQLTISRIYTHVIEKASASRGLFARAFVKKLQFHELLLSPRQQFK